MTTVKLEPANIEINKTGQDEKKTAKVKSRYSVSTRTENKTQVGVQATGYFVIQHDIPKINNAIDIVQFIRRNRINFEYFNHLKNIATLSDQTISDWLHVSAKTFASYRTPGGILPKENTQEQVLMLIALYKHSEEVFDSNEDFSKWLNTPNFYFDNQKPLEDLGTISGIRFIYDRLTAMAYGDNV